MSFKGTWLSHEHVKQDRYRGSVFNFAFAFPYPSIYFYCKPGSDQFKM